MPICPALREVLLKMDRHPDGRVFHGPRGGLVKSDKVRRIFVHEVLDPLASRFPDTRFIEGRFHSFRHYFCSASANEGTSEQVLMRWLGHRHSRMVQRYYHLRGQESLRQISRVKLFEAADVQPSVTHPGNGGSPSTRRSLTTGSQSN